MSQDLQGDLGAVSRHIELMGKRLIDLEQLLRSQTGEESVIQGLQQEKIELRKQISNIDNRLLKLTQEFRESKPQATEAPSGPHLSPGTFIIPGGTIKAGITYNSVYSETVPLCH